MSDKKLIEHCEQKALNMRRNIIELAYRAGTKGAHLAPSLSIVEIIAVLYTQVMQLDPRDMNWDNRDRFLLSKGHGALGYYVGMYEAGIISKEDLYTFEMEGGAFPGQPSKNIAKGIEYSGGSLGLGLSYGAGLALGAKRKGKTFHTFVLMGDGELNEGSVWESAMFAKHQQLSNLTVIVDRNNMQSDGFCKAIMDYDVEAIWGGFGWEVIRCDGHDIKSLLEAFGNKKQESPRVIVANTVKGKGISFMENAPEWHHNRLTDELYEKAMNELSGRNV